MNSRKSHLSARKQAAIIVLALALLLLALAPSFEQVALASIWYLQVRYDRPNYTYVNAQQEIADPVNLALIAKQTGY